MSQNDYECGEVERTANVLHVSKGTVTRFYPQGRYLYFHVSGDEMPYAYEGYNVLDLEDQTHRISS